MIVDSVALAAGSCALDYDCAIYLKDKKDGHPLFIQQGGCGGLGARGRWRVARWAPPALVMFQILRKFHTEEMSTVKAERPAPHHRRTAE